MCRDLAGMSIVSTWRDTLDPVSTTAAHPRRPAPPWLRRAGRWLGVYAISVVIAGIITLPLVLERAVEQVRFSDRLGTFPVNVSLCHNGRSTLDTGVLGKVYWDQTGFLGFGAYARSTGPPEAGGTLASYVSPSFFQANIAFIDDPEQLVDAYSARFREEARETIARDLAVAALLGGALIAVVMPHRRMRGWSRTRVVVVVGLLTVTATGVSTVVAARMFAEWPCSGPVESVYAMPGSDLLSFESPETLEVAQQIRPFIEKNTERFETRAREYEARADATFRAALRERADELAPRDGETIVIAEGDTQGSFVGVDVRANLYGQLVDAWGDDAFALRSISGDISSNGTVAEKAYIEAEAGVAPDIRVVAVGGDHDSETTWDQLKEAKIVVPDLETKEVGDLRVAGANDREHKSLFGGLVTNDSGISEEELGTQLRERVDEDLPDDPADAPRLVLLHQPDAVDGYVGPPGLAAIEALPDQPTIPYDDGIPDLPPGTVNIGHRHVLDGPWVVWNTDGDTITWTVIDQLGTAGGVENSPTFNRFSTPVSVPLKPITARLQYFSTDSGLQTGYATIRCGVDGRCDLTDRTEVGLPGGEPLGLASR